MARIYKIAPALLALPFLLVGCDQLSGLISKKDSAAPAAAQARVTRVTTIEMKPHKVDIQRELTGRTVAYRWAEVRPEVSGILKERCFTEGSLVKEGDVLYRIEPDTYKAALDKAKADLASAEANLNVTKLRERRTASMLKTKSVSQQDYDDVKATLRQAEATVQSCKAAVDSAEINYRRTEVRAPISGRIGLSNFTVGALLTASQATPLATIYQTDPMYVELSQSSDDLYSLKKQFDERGGSVKSVNPSNIKATLTMHDGSYYPAAGHLNFTGVDVDQNTNTVTMRAEFPNPDGVLLPGLFVRTSVVMGQDDQAVLAPQKAVLRDLKGLPYVYIVKDGKAERQNITISHAIGNDWYVTDGLKIGDEIILNGINNVRGGQPVQVVSEEAMQAEQSAGGNK